MKHAIVAAGVALLANAAGAQPPVQGWSGAFPHPSILCDTSAQLRSIVDAFEKGPEAGKARYAELFTRLNYKREPTCAVTAVLGVALSVEQLGVVDFGDSELYGWMVHVENDSGAGYFLYLETPAEALGNTI